MGILQDGRLVALEDIDTLLERGGKRVQVSAAGELAADLQNLEGVFDIETPGEAVHFTYTGDYSLLIQQLSRYEIQDIQISEPPLEDVFLHFYGDNEEVSTEEAAAGGDDA